MRREGYLDLLQLAKVPPGEVLEVQVALSPRAAGISSVPREASGPDRDRDGIPDAADRCPLISEDLDHFEDEDGCPEIDNDLDGIVDTRDKCPNQAEDFDMDNDEDGCPDPYIKVVAGDRMMPGKAGVEWVYSDPAGVYFTLSEVNAAQFRYCVEADECDSRFFKTTKDHEFCNFGHEQRYAHPMNCLSWDGARQFCEWIDGRLPTEEEWEAEATASGTRSYPWGDREVSCELAIWGDGSQPNGCGTEHTWPVCSIRVGDSISGLCDMAGNVWEWTDSREGALKVLRGGSWNYDNPECLKSTYRFLHEPSTWSNFAGVRCVHEPN